MSDNVQKKNSTLANVAIVTTLGLTGLNFVWQVASERSAINSTLATQITRTDTHERRLNEHDLKIQDMQRTTDRIATDVRWIRETLEKTQK